MGTRAARDLGPMPEALRKGAAASGTSTVHQKRIARTSERGSQSGSGAGAADDAQTQDLSGVTQTTREASRATQSEVELTIIERGQRHRRRMGGDLRRGWHRLPLRDHDVRRAFEHEGSRDHGPL